MGVTYVTGVVTVVGVVTAISVVTYVVCVTYLTTVAGAAGGCYSVLGIASELKTISPFSRASLTAFIPSLIR